MGGKMILNFLQQMTDSWKDQYVKKFIALGVPWGGSVKALHGMSIGRGILSLINHKKLKQVLETYPSLVWLIPSKFAWENDEMIAYLEKIKYTIANLDKYFEYLYMFILIVYEKNIS